MQYKAYAERKNEKKNKTEAAYDSALRLLHPTTAAYTSILLYIACGECATAPCTVTHRSAPYVRHAR